MSIVRTLAKRAVLAAPNGPKAALKGLLPGRLVWRVQRALSNSAVRADKSAASGRPSSSSSPGKQIRRLEERLWGGYASYAVRDLEQLILAPRTNAADRVHAAMVLGRYYAARGDYLTALERLAFVRTAAPRLGSERRVRWVEVRCLLALGRIEDARHLVELSLRYGSESDGDNCVAMAAVCRAAGLAGETDADEAIEHSLMWLSRPLEAAGFVGLTRQDPARDLTLNNLAASTAPPAAALSGPKVSVLMAAFNAEDNIETAIRSVLEQSWRNLELVAVDDASTDRTWEILKRIAETDSRVVPVRHATNGGAYVARNTALAHATGRYVVVNDADDWAHPQKIEAQVRDMEAHGGDGANMTFRLRVDPNIIAEPRLDSPHVPIIHNDFSALMVERERVLDVGGWDPVRFSADAEFVQRLRASKSDFQLRKIHAGIPLSISLFDGKNLTASSATSIWTNRFGSRLEYERAFRAWHAEGDLHIARRSQTDPFPVPGLSYNSPGARQRFDIVLISDFRLAGGTTQCNLQYLMAFRRQGLSVAVLHWPRYDIEPRDSALPKIVTACRELGVVPLVHGEEVDCGLLLIHHPPVMMWQPDAVPSINAEQVAILANQSAQRVRHGPNEMYEPAEVQARVVENFGKPGIWIPISPVVRRLMREAGGFDPVAEEDWLPVLDLQAWRRAPRWRGQERKRPVIGRHSRDQWIKWPGAAEDIAAAYCADRNVTVRLMGGAKSALDTLGHHPTNWEVLDFDAEDTPTFLASLDIFVHFIHADSIEAFGRNIMEAMAAGLPVVCSESFRECFGDAALYAEPHEAVDVINALWADRERYESQARKGQAFVEAYCSLDVVAGRLERLRADGGARSRAGAVGSAREVTAGERA